MASRQKGTSWIEDARCEDLGLDAKRVASVARRLASAAAEARAMDLIVFGGSGSGTLRHVPTGCGTAAIVAWLGRGFDGGDGGDA